jgi:hypothetical protein
MGYFNNLDNEIQNKYLKNLNNKKTLTNVFLLIDLYCFKFYIISLSFDSSLNIIKILYNLQRLQFNGL